VAVLAKIIKNDTLRKSFGYKLQAFVNPRTGRIHSSYMICGTESGRASCNTPNIQQIPTDERLRSLFRAADGHALVLGDYGSMELRAAGCISGDRKLLNVFEQGLDLHAMTASTMLGKPPIEVSPEERKVGKTTNFGAVYGQGARGLQSQLWKNLGLWISLDEAAAFSRDPTLSSPNGGRTTRRAAISKVRSSSARTRALAAAESIRAPACLGTGSFSRDPAICRFKASAQTSP
jgi:DNA polymerase I-like protein with 3'-5' exonuclease and polymerase domains